MKTVAHIHFARRTAGGPFMLIQTYEQALADRERILSKIDATANAELLGKARSMWNAYAPQNGNSTVAGIDSSWNLVMFQGYYLYAVEAVSSLADNSFLVPPRYTVDLSTLGAMEGNQVVFNPRLYLESLGMEFEYGLATESAKKIDFVLVDGSVLARFYDRRLKKPIRFYEFARDLMAKENIVFVSKTSESNVILEGGVGDLFYFNKASRSPGFSSPYYDKIGVSVFYARLAEFTPCIKVEVPGDVDNQRAERLLDLMSAKSYSGYPYVLRLAHERCKVANEDMSRLANVLGLEIETGGREVLGE